MCALLIVHAPLIFNDGLHGDDWLFLKIKPDFPVQMDVIIHGAGHPILWLYTTLANLSGYPVAAMTMMALAGIAIGAVTLFGFTQRLRIFSVFEAAVFTFLVWSYAEYHNWATKLTASYVFSLALLCLGLNLFAIVLSSERVRPALRLASLLTIFFSFMLNSLIVAYYIGLCIALLFVPHAGVNRDVPIKRLLARLVRSADFIAVPIVYWFSINYFFPKIGPYASYYQIKLPQLADLVAGLERFWGLGFVRIATEAEILARETIRPLGLAIVIASVLVAILAKLARESRAPSMHATAWPFLAAAVVFLGLASPYLVSGISPSEHFFESRHLILFGIPLGLGAIGLSRAAHKAFGTDKAGHLIIVPILALNLCALWSGYFLQQARWLRLEAMIDQLHAAYREPPATVFNLVDGFLGHGDHTFYGLTELTGALHAAWDERPLFAFTGRYESPAILQQMAALNIEGSAFRNIDTNGPQATITLAPKQPILSSARLSMIHYRCVMSSCDRTAMLRSLAETSVQLGPIPHLFKTSQ